MPIRIRFRREDMSKVYIVHCVDTEGPLYQDFSVPFQMINEMYGLSIEPTEENLYKLQNQLLPLGGHEEDAAIIMDPHRIKFQGDWTEIEDTLNVITAEEFRRVLPDSNGDGWKYSWFCMDHVGFTGDNPRRRDAGFHKIYDRYKKMVDEQKKGDIVEFHFHPIAHYGNFNDSGITFWRGDVLNEILCRDIIDRQFFPTAFRPGFHTERPDSNWFLEQWIPFDYGNQSGFDGSGQPDMDAGRFGDWRGASEKWYPYHPSHDDYRKKGCCRRWITRCLNMYARARQLEMYHVEEAFKQAELGKDAILAFTGHDYKDIVYEINRVRELIREVSCKYPGVSFEYQDAITAYRKCMKLQPEMSDLEADIINDGNGLFRLEVKSKHDIFGPQPYLAIKDKFENYFWDNFDMLDHNKWTYVFDHNTVFYSDVLCIGVAANNIYGECEIVTIKDGKACKKIRNSI